VLEDEKQVLGLWCVVIHTNCVDQKRFAKKRIGFRLENMGRS